MSSIRTETETVVKKIFPYLERRGYDIKKDLDLETAVRVTDRYSIGYVDILVNTGTKRPKFLIEAKRIAKNLTSKDRDQAISYAKTKEIDVPFVVVTNGINVQCFNTKTKDRILWDGKSEEKIPTKEQLKKVIRTLKTDPTQSAISISDDISLPFRPGLALRQLNALFYKCHSAIRKIEKNEESAFADFSKLLFLKLLEEKADINEDFELPYSYRFHKLAEIPTSEADQIKFSVMRMIEEIIKKRAYGEVLEDKLLLKNPKTYRYIVKELASVSFCDSSLDSKGVAFEYFVRATLKGKKLGQYFTPRQLVRVMLAIVGQNKIINSVISSRHIKVLDPACGTGGFLVYLMQDSLSKLDVKLKAREINRDLHEHARKRIKEEIFFGSDANEGVAASAKMNMIIAGDGHSNIQQEDSLSVEASNWSVSDPDCDLILTNPPFGTSETDSLSQEDWKQYEVAARKGQHLFLQKMVLSLKPDSGELCTVIDEGVLNTESASSLRKWLLQNCRIKAVFNLPPETFKPNKINVKSSLVYLERRKCPDYDFEENYKVTFCKLYSLGYHASGEDIRGFEFEKFLSEIAQESMDTTQNFHKEGYHWEAFDIEASEITADSSFRLDYKYWHVDTRNKIKELLGLYGKRINDLNQIETSRGKSPAAENYVDEADGYALVIKSGSSISKHGSLIKEGADWIEKSVYDSFLEQAEQTQGNFNVVKQMDILLASTGDGTLGKCCVYEEKDPAIADGHVTIIRVDPGDINPYYLCDYLRAGFGAEQINRLFTGSTGMIELTPEQVDTIVIDMRDDLEEQRILCNKIREIEAEYLSMIRKAEEVNESSKNVLKNVIGTS